MDRVMKACLWIIKIVFVIGFIFGMMCFFSETPESSGLISQIRLWVTGLIICLGCGLAIAFIKYMEES